MANKKNDEIIGTVQSILYMPRNVSPQLSVTLELENVPGLAELVFYERDIKAIKPTSKIAVTLNMPLSEYDFREKPQIVAPIWRIVE